MVKVACPLCGEKVEERVYDLHVIIEAEHLIKIRKEHPEWIEVDGACPECIQYYRKKVGAGLKPAPTSSGGRGEKQHT